MRIVFMGSPDFSVPALQALVDAGHEIAAVYCQPPRPAGRGKKDRPTAVHVAANELGLAVYTPKSLKSAEETARFQALKADIAVVVAYGLILPQGILDAPKLGCLNIHASLLPRWRGAAPIHRAIMAGDPETGVAIMQMEAGLDTGPVLAERRLAIAPDTTTGALHDDLSVLGAALIVEVLADLAAHKPHPQSAEGVTYAEKIQKAEARIDWQADAIAIDRQIRGLSPFPGAWCEMAGERVKILGSTLASGQGAPGEVLDDHLTIACGTGTLRLTRLQRSGKGAMDAVDFLRGFAPEVGSRLG